MKKIKGGLRPIARSTMVDEVATQVRALIDGGQFPPGHRLPGELEMVAQLKVSRAVVREAIRRLETIGLVTVRHGRGLFVGDRSSLANCVQFVRTALSISPREKTQMVELREAIEVFAARRAAELATPEDVAELADLFARMTDETLAPLEAEQLDLQFHRRIVELTGNPLLWTIIEVLHAFGIAGLLHATQERVLHGPRNYGCHRPIHQAILEAIHAGDPDGAERAMKNHMKAVAADLADRLRADQQRQAGGA